MILTQSGMIIYNTKLVSHTLISLSFTSLLLLQLLFPITARPLLSQQSIELEVTFGFEIDSTNILSGGFEPLGIAVSSDRIFLSYFIDVIDQQSIGESGILILDREFRLIKKITNVAGRNIDPLGLDVFEDRLYVADISNNSVFILDTTGAFIKQWGTSGSENGQFSSPRDVAINRHFIYVADNKNNRIQVFNHSQSWIGNGDEFVSDVKHLAADENKLYSTSTRTNPVTKYDTFVQTESEWGTAAVLGDGINVGPGEFNFNAPNGIAVVSPYVFVGDWLAGRIQVFDESGNYLTDFLSIGNSEYQIEFLFDLDADENLIFTIDISKKVIAVFEYGIVQNNTSPIEELSTSNIEVTYTTYQSSSDRATLSIHTFVLVGFVALRKLKVNRSN